MSEVASGNSVWVNVACELKSACLVATDPASKAPVGVRIRAQWGRGCSYGVPDVLPVCGEQRTATRDLCHLSLQASACWMRGSCSDFPHAGRAIPFSRTRQFLSRDCCRELIRSNWALLMPRYSCRDYCRHTLTRATRDVADGEGRSFSRF